MLGEFGEFVRQHIWPSIAAVMGAAVAVASIVLDAIHVHELGLPWWTYQVIGNSLFFMAVIFLLYRFHSKTSSGLPPRATAGLSE